MKQEEFFSSRWTLILSTLGIAVGTGNIWRFSRVVAQNGGGSFLIPWVVFLFVWSIPLIITEFAIGKHTRFAPVGAFTKTAGPRFAWMGAFIVFVTTAIMFYYSVITGWCIRYLYSALSGELMSNSDFLQLWNNFSSGSLPVMFHFLAIFFAALVVYRGVVHGIEKASKILVATLLILLIILAIRAVTLPGAFKGITYLFTPELEYITDYKVWLNALTQNAWDTGAGWGLFLVYATYIRKKEDVPLNAALIGFGNNSVSLLAGITIFSTVFALSTSGAIEQISQSGPANTGMTFIYLPLLFSKMSGSTILNTFFALFFFVALFFAAFSSLISMVELSARTLIDLGLKRKLSIIIVTTAGFLLGIPSAFSLDFLVNQDWVWGIALIISGAFIAFAVIKFGVDKFRTTLINELTSDIKIGKVYNFIIKYLIPFQVIVLIFWWFFYSISWDPEWWNPFHSANIGTCVLQWTIIITVLIILNKKLNQWTERNEN